MIEIAKRKASSLFKPPDRVIILNAVDKCHHIISEASHLLKAYYLHHFENSENPLALESCLELDETLLEVCCLVVAHEKLQIRKIKDKQPNTTNTDKLEAAEKRKEAAKQTKNRKKRLYDEITSLYNSHFPGAVKPKTATPTSTSSLESDHIKRAANADKVAKKTKQAYELVQANAKRLHIQAITVLASIDYSNETEIKKVKNLVKKAAKLTRRAKKADVLANLAAQEAVKATKEKKLAEAKEVEVEAKEVEVEIAEAEAEDEEAKDKKTNKKEAKLSMSHILQYSIAQTITAYNNNVWMHFPKYVKKVLTCTLFCNRVQASSDKITKEEKKQFRAVAAKACNHILYGEGEEWTKGEDVKMLANQFSHLVPNLPTPTTNRLYDMKARPWRYLQYMVWMNRHLENTMTPLQEKFSKMCKLYSPISLISTFIPNHIRLDTSGLAQLLMNQKRIVEFVNFYEIKTGIKLQMTSKADMLSSYSKLTGVVAATAKDEALYATTLWTYLCDFTNYKDVLSSKRKSEEVWVFDNAIVTDGYSASFQITKEANLQRKHMFKQTEEKKKLKDEKQRLKAEKQRLKAAKQKKKKSKDTEASSSNEGDGSGLPGYLDDAFISWWKQTPENYYRHLSADPGKTDLGDYTDGFTNLKYRKARRDCDTFANTRKNTSLQKRHKAKVKGIFGNLNNPSVHDYESIYMSENSKKSCVLEKFMKYWKSRQAIVNLENNLYKKAYFRNIKFTVHVKQKSSESKIIDKIQKLFLNKSIGQKKRNQKHDLLPIHKPVPYWLRTGEISRATQCMLDNRENASQCQEILMGYGNWGRSPNLCGSAPTPGIGLRRRIHKHLHTATVDEGYTSKPCPCCGKDLTYPQVGKAHVSKHHLQRCINEACPCSWWNRNTTGSHNILRRFIEKSLCQKASLGIKAPGVSHSVTASEDSSLEKLQLFKCRQQSCPVVYQPIPTRKWTNCK
jgi:hypothetical protein